MGFFLFMVIAGVVVYNLLKNAKANQEQWRVAAERLGLGYHSGDFGLSGTISGRKGGHRIVISTFSQSGGNNSKTYTKYHIDYHDRIPVDFKITRQNALHSIGHAFGMQDIGTGNPSFDNRALVRGMHPKQVKKFLTPDRQAVITDLMMSYNDVTISNEMIELNKPGKEKNSSTIIRMADLLLSMCNDLTDLSGSIASQAEKSVEIEPVEPPCNPLFSAQPIVPDPPMVEIEEEPLPTREPPPVPEIPEPVPTVSEEPPPVPESPEPVPVVVEELPPIPESPEPVPVVVEELPPIPESPEPVPIVSDEPAPSNVSHDIRAIAEDLYAGDSSATLKTEPRFEEVYCGQMVTGTGTIQRVSKLSYDPVFKDYKGVKAICEICELSGAYSKIKVKADIVFPSERFDELNNKVGSSISIAGKLIHQNAMMHHLYILGE